MAFAALIRHDCGEATLALSGLLAALAATSTDPDVARYRRSIGRYAQSLGSDR